MAKYLVKYEIETNYDRDELKEVIEKLFDIPALQYEDCDEFNYEYVYIDIAKK